MNSNYNELAGKVVAGCELIRELGRGTNGIVYLAKQQNLNRLVACKIISGDLQDDPDFMDNLFTEAANAAKLSHPNIIQALNAGSDDSGLKYFMMEYVEGTSLETIRLESPEKISTKFLLNISLQLASAMDYVWQQHQMIHGDIKPGNLLVASEGNILKIGDLGLARSSNGVSDPDDVMITPLYAAPEIISQSATGPSQQSDIYSFGVMFYELACGKAPFTGSIEEILQGHLSVAPVPLIVMNPDFDRELSQFIDSMLAKDPAMRPADWKSVSRKLQEIRSRLLSGTPLPPEPPKPAPAARASRQTSWSAEKKTNNKIMAKFPWLLPALLIIVILGALLSIPFSMGLFK